MTSLTSALETYFLSTLYNQAVLYKDLTDSYYCLVSTWMGDHHGM